MAQRRKKPAKQSREPVPGELDQDEESWSGLKVAAACAGVVCVLFLGWLAWQSLLAAGIVGGVLAALAPFARIFWDMLNHFREED